MNVYELCLKEIMKQYIIRVHGKRILEPKRKFFLKYSAPFRRSTFVLIQCSTKDLYFTTNCILNGLYRLTDKYPRWWENGQKRSKNELLVREREIDLEKKDLTTIDWPMGWSRMIDDDLIDRKWDLIKNSCNYFILSCKNADFWPQNWRR